MSPISIERLAQLQQFSESDIILQISEMELHSVLAELLSVRAAATSAASVPRLATARMVAAAAPGIDPSPDDYGVAQSALEFLPPSDHPDIADVLAQIAADYRVMIATAEADGTKPS